jgi:hypothetical protein
MLLDQPTLVPGLDCQVALPGGAIAPFPSIIKGFDLGCCLGAGLIGEEDVVTGVAVQGRVKVDQVHRLVLDVAAQDVQVVAIVEQVHEGFLVLRCKEWRRLLLRSGYKKAGHGVLSG